MSFSKGGKIQFSRLFYVNIAFLNGRKGVKEEKRLKDTDNVGKKEHLLLPLHQQIKQKR